MRKLLAVSAVSLALAVGPALAADLPAVIDKAPPPSPPTWTACYANAGVGYGLWNIDHNAETFPGLAAVTLSATDGGRGWLGRFGGGCDYQFQLLSWNVLVGGFGDYDAMNLTGTVQPQFAVGGLPTQAAEKEQNAWTAGARVGVLISPTVLGFFDGGYTQTTFGTLSEFTTIGAPTGFGFASATYRGWFLGSGFETSLASIIPGLALPGLYWRTEYRYSSYNAVDLPEINLATGAPAAAFGIHMTPTVQTVTTTLVYKFNFLNMVFTR
jgi:outer membrane immunogenic protein